ncbi:Hsp20/alpha crystallin family protein [Bacillus thermotolerans]|uniref:Hsp20/alpha crystallin family protein n=1 Tax=Bacillus thermotolerans TaxID=1221996 RepID=A0A0F5I899_BACTR|nr:Hsp20/alpha crystallin family protein [Bacillus thermotolerans]KKB34246.1 hypothetical protein QY97_02570 [Bacillus thermotolerans]KKB41741.1 hypothetical protein QY95_00548 [Bacillus thermotolerans]KKB44367.1 hypothetical protein QY96_02967 [Bacillus thermotolerans]
MNHSQPKQEVRTPRMDLFELESSYYLRLSLPGVKRENMRLFFNERGLLEVKGKVITALPKQLKHTITQEIYEGPFHRTIELPGEVNRQTVRFNYEGGVLEIFLEKQL